jgi:hypothetical protein
VAQKVHQLEHQHFPKIIEAVVAADAPVNAHPANAHSGNAGNAQPSDATRSSDAPGDDLPNHR